MADDRIYLRCCTCHTVGDSPDYPGPIAKVSGGRAHALSDGSIVLARLLDFFEAHKLCGYRGFYLCDELGRPLPGASASDDEPLFVAPSVAT